MDTGGIGLTFMQCYIQQTALPASVLDMHCTMLLVEYWLTQKEKYIDACKNCSGV